MFTGIIEGMGRVSDVSNVRDSKVFSVEGGRVVRTLKKGDSLSVDGVCLTILNRAGTRIKVRAVEETLRKTTLGSLRKGSWVNLERPLAATGRLDGHFVLGHVDTTARIKRIDHRASSWMVRIGISPRYAPLLIHAGSVAINGVSLTVAGLSPSALAVSIIPHTWNVTTFQFLKEGDEVNIEFDVLGKYIVTSIRRTGRKR